MASTADPTGALSVRLSAGTRAAARDTGFLRALAAGRLPRQAYADFVAQQFFLHEALESAAAAMADDPVAGVFVFPGLTRLPSIMADLADLCGPAWADAITALPATADYCARLRAVAFDRPSSFVAHHYTRNLGEQSGDPADGRSIAQVYGAGKFCTFDGLDQVALRGRYRALLDATAWQPAEQEHFLTEAALAYRLNGAVLGALQGRWH